MLTQAMAHNCLHADTLAKCRALNSKEYAAMLSVVMKGLENGFQVAVKIINLCL